MNDELSARELASLPVFPLPNVVLFPGTTLALHIFEARYREMMADCLREGPMALAMAQLKPGWQADYHGRPPFHAVAGAGRIGKHQMRRDGTYDLELQGLARVRLQELPAAGRSYRRAAASVLLESTPPVELPRGELASLLNLAVQILEIVQPGQRVQVRLSASLDDEPALLLDKLADQFVADPEVRQRLLETLDLATRLRELKRCLAELHLGLASATGDEDTTGSRVLH